MTKRSKKKLHFLKFFSRDDYDEDHYIPQHPCFTLMSNCEQVISRVLSRRLLTFEKTKEPTVSLPVVSGVGRKIVKVIVQFSRCRSRN